jgi:FkbM family methyltransferase
MNFKTYLKSLARSRSISFANAMNQTDQSGEMGSIDIDGIPFYYRLGTSDPHLIYQILLKAKGEYQMPDAFSADVIFDIGANIGTTARYFARQFPKATIYCFEPVSENFLMLQENTKSYPNIRIFNFGLGSKTESIEIFHSDNDSNFGGFSRFAAGSDLEKSSPVKIVSCNDFFAQEQVKPIDFIKIDTEGAEYDILTAMPLGRLMSAKWIVGELHDQNDFKLLDFLSEGFEIGIKKTLGKRLSMFYAKRRM